MHRAISFKKKLFMRLKGQKTHLIHKDNLITTTSDT